MMTFFGFLAWLGAVEGAAGEAVPMGTRLSVVAIELPRAVTPTVAGLTVGAFVGVVGFIAVLLLVDRGGRRPTRRAARVAVNPVVFIPPYGPMPRDLVSAQASATRALAMPATRHERDADPSVFFEVDMRDDDDLAPSESPARGLAAVTVSRVVVLASTPPAREERPAFARADEASAPHPLGIISSSSSAMRAAPIADLAFDDGPTEIGETYFDEPPQPRRRTDPPRIRAVQPAGPRFPERAPIVSPGTPPLTPPPARTVMHPRPSTPRG